MSLKDKFEQEIHSMDQQGIISKLDCNQATEWLKCFVVVKKPNGELRICLDPTNLSKYNVRPVCNSNTLDEVSFKLKDAKFFLVFDATKGFFHLLLNEKSKLSTAMLTPLGVYVFNVLTMGLSNSNDLFESKSINKRQPASNNNIILVYGVLCHGQYTPSTPIFGVIHPPCNAIFMLQSTISTRFYKNQTKYFT